MVDNARVMSRPRHPRRRRGLPAAAIIATAVLALAAYGSGGGGPSSTGGSPNAGVATNSASAVAHSACMRYNGVPNFPDPDSKGNPPQADPQHLGVSSSQHQAAEQACQHLLPTGGSLQQQTQQCLLYGDSTDLLQQLLTVERTYAQCMRSHGVPTWPDPTVGAKGRPVFDLSRAGIDPQSTDSSQFQSKEAECRSLTGGTVPNLPVT